MSMPQSSQTPSDLKDESDGVSIASKNTVDNSPEPSPTQFNYGFFDKNSVMTRTRTIYLKTVAGGVALVSLTILAIFAIYWGALWKTTSHFPNFDGWIVNFDNGAIGHTAVETFSGLNPNTSLKWKLRNASDFSGPDDVAAAVLSQKIWVAITINSGATARLTQAALDADSSYNGTRAITVFATEARNENGYRSLIKPNIDAILQQMSATFARQYVSSMSNATNLGVLALAAPQIITQPVYYSIQNLRPFDIPVATAVTFVGLIYLSILSFVITGIHAAARQISGLEKRLTLRSLIFVRLASPSIAYFVVTLSYSLLNLGFQLPLGRHFKAGFLIFWMSQWFGMMALGLGIESMFTFLAQQFTPFFVIFWIILNVSVSLFPIEALAGVYGYGYAMPFYHISQSVRAVVFGTKNHLGENFGVLIAWVTASFVSMPLLVWFTRRREIQILRPKEPKSFT